MDKALSVTQKKDDVYYNRAKLIYNYMLGNPEKAYKDWSYDKAADEIRKAIAVQELPVYVQTEGDILFAPLDGKVKLVASTKHAIGFEANNKAEILMHIGLDTVSLEGKGFELLIKEGDRVKHGTPVLKINRQFMKERNIDLTTPIVVTNSEYKVFKSNITDVTTDSVIMECTKN